MRRLIGKLIAFALAAGILWAGLLPASAKPGTVNCNNPRNARICCQCTSPCRMWC
jgi:hypothetical protein